MRPILAAALVLTLGVATAAEPDPQWDISGLKRLKPEDGTDVASVPPPRGAIVLFDGKNLDGWTKKDGKTPAGWKIVEVSGGKAMEVTPKQGDVITRETFGGRFKLHVEFRVPYLPKASGQGRANSGVYVQGRYEVQVLDSYGLDSKNNDCGAIYEVAAPLKNACKAPTVWQSYDIEFTPPKFENGKKVEPAMMTVWHNGEKIHDQVKIPVDVTRAGLKGDPAGPGPILLQDHGQSVQYRNLWLLPLDK